MRATISSGRFVILGLFWTLAGCQVTDWNADPTDGGVDFTFADDEDPALAALSYVETQLLAQPYPGADPDTLDALFHQAGATVIDESQEIQIVLLEVPPGRLGAVAAGLAASGLIDTLQKNYIFEPVTIPNDPMYGQQEHLKQIRAPKAWDVAVSSEQIIIAIVDTGVDGDHPDLTGKVRSGRNVFDRNNNYQDVEGHGTMVAGVAAAISNNGVGVAGVAWDSPILPVRIADGNGVANAWDLAVGIFWSVKNGAKIINVSFAPLWSNRVVRSAARFAYRSGSLVVISSGNDGITATSIGYDEALFVGAVNGNNEIAFFSNRGPFVDLVAPGTSVRTTALGGSYQFGNGTSFAAPIVSGVAALVWSRDPDLRPFSVRQAVLDAADDLGPAGKDDTFGHGAVDAYAAVSQPLPALFVPDTTAPTLSVEKPQGGDLLSGRAVASVTVHDDEGVNEVVLSVDGVVLATDTDEPYRFVIDTARFTRGRYELSFQSTDMAGNTSPVQTVAVSFEPAAASASPPTDISFDAPPPGTSVSGDVHIQATVADADGLATVEWLVDGTSIFTGPVSGRSSGVSFLWRTDQVPSGSHTITIVVTDAVGQQSSDRLELVKP